MVKEQKSEYTAEYTKELEEEEDRLFSLDDENEVPPADIVAYNELRSCADLVRMYQTKQLIIQPDFQRDLVWSKAAQTRFIDSLVKQLPIPSMCISLDYKTGERLMIDGLQRISSVISFLTDENWKLSNLDDVNPSISGKTPKQIKDKDYDTYSRLENLTIPVTILRCDYSKHKHMEYLFTIFHRLNTGGNKLNNQEIRNCIYHGNFNNFLKQVVASDRFINLFGLDTEKSYRFAYEELLLRCLAFDDGYEDYRGKLAKFLNDYMERNRWGSEEDLLLKKNLVNRVLKLLYVRVLSEKSLPKLSKATMEAIYVGLSRNIDALENLGDDILRQKLKELRNDKLFSVDALKEGLSAKDKVIDRLNRAVEIFS